MRGFCVILHRYAGLTIALFVLIASVTGSLLAFNDELTDATQPWRLVAPPTPQAPLLDPLMLNAAAAAAAPQGYSVDGLRLNVRAGRALEVGISPPAGTELPFLDVALDPYTAEVLHIGEWGAIAEGWPQIMPFIYQLHYKLALGDIGLWAFGIAALIWTIDCFIGFYLTLPASRGRLWSRWGKAFRVRWSARPNKLNFDLHRASGLWLWPILLVFAWSSVGMNLPEVYNPVMKAAGAEDPYDSLPDRPASAAFVPDYAAALRIARDLARHADVHVVSEWSLYFDASKNAYSYNFRSDRDFTDKGGWSALLFYPDGTLARAIIADGGLDEGGADNWLMALHMANVGGMTYRIFVCALGLLIALLTVTGVVIWMQKRSARIASSAMAHAQPRWAVRRHSGT
jgi:uncharacterized iron-regulated membrane protein